jgi:hypothetical protein
MPIAIMLTGFVVSCIGLGYLAEVWRRRWKWPKWLGGVMMFLIGCLWPVILVAYVIYTGNRYIAQHPGEVNDAPPMVLMGVITISPFIFLAGLSLGLLGLFMARRKTSVGGLR